MRGMKKSKKSLPWEYCECGCHGHTVSIGSLDYWMFDDLHGKYYLHKGHGLTDKRLGRYSSFGAADRATRKDAKSKIAELRLELDKAIKLLRD